MTPLESAARLFQSNYGVTRERFVTFVKNQITLLATKHKWSPSERAASLADVEITADRVWGTAIPSNTRKVR